MAALEEVHKGDIGTVFTIIVADAGVAVDISSATTKDINFLKPDGTTTLNKAASFTTDGTDGSLSYTTIAADLDTVGKWQKQANVAFGGGNWKTAVVEFKVMANAL